MCRGDESRVAGRIVALVAIAALVLLLVPTIAFGATLSGKVSGQSIGKSVEPLPGASVTVLDPETGSAIGSTTTGILGEYSIAAPAGVFDVRFAPAPGQLFDTTTVHNVDLNAPRTLDVVLVSGSTVRLTGFVRDAQGTPIVDAKVILEGKSSSAQQRTDEQGFYSLAVLPGTYTLSANGSGASPAASSPWAVGLGAIAIEGDTSRDISLPATSILTVEALGAGDAPIAGANLSLPTFTGSIEAGSLGFTSITSGGFSGKTDSQGRARFGVFTGASVSAGKQATIVPPAGSGYAQTNFALPKVDQDTTVVVRPTGTVRLTGFVRDAQGTPIVDAKVILEGKSSSAQQRTDEQGFYSLAVLPGTYTLSANGSGASPAASSPWAVGLGAIAIEGDTSRDISLPATSILTVEALGAGDAPIAGANLSLPTFTGSIEAGSLGFTSITSGGFSGKTDSQGRARFGVFTGASVSAGKQATIVPPAGSGYAQTNFALPKVDQDTTVVVRPTGTVRLTGFVRDAQGTPIVDAKVILEGKSSSAQQRTDEQGFYSLAVLPGTYTLSANGSGASPAASSPWAVGLGAIAIEGDTSRDISLPATSILTVEALGAGDAPIAGANLSLPTFTGSIEAGSLGFTSITSGGFSGKTDSQGRARFGVFTGASVSAGKQATIVPPAGSGYAQTNFALPKVDQDTTVVVRFQGPANDTEPPTLTIDAEPTGQNGWFTSDPAIAVARASDASLASLTCSVDKEESSLQSSGGSEPLELEVAVGGEGRHEVGCVASDTADNRSEAGLPVRIDVTSPPAAALSPDRPPDYASTTSWYRDEVTITATGGDDPLLADGSPGSGVDPASIPAPMTFAAGGAHEAIVVARDLAGNVSPASTLTVNVDADPPSSTLECPGDVEVGSAAVATWLDADGESGLVGPASGTQALGTTQIGSHVVTHVASDRVGHSTAGECSYRVVYPFFAAGKTALPPQFNRRSGNSKKVSVEFSLGGDRGLEIFRPEFPQVQPIDCTSGVATGAPFPAVAAAPLSYRSNHDIYEYRWDVGDLGKNGCVALLLGFDDETTREIWLEL